MHFQSRCLRHGGRERQGEWFFTTPIYSMIQDLLLHRATHSIFVVKRKECNTAYCSSSSGGGPPRETSLHISEFLCNSFLQWVSVWQSRPDFSLAACHAIPPVHIEWTWARALPTKLWSARFPLFILIRLPTMQSITVRHGLRKTPPRTLLYNFSACSHWPLTYSISKAETSNK